MGEEVCGGLLGGEYALYVEALEDSNVEVVGGAGIYVTYAVFEEEGHGLDAGAEVLADGDDGEVYAGEGEDG